MKRYNERMNFVAYQIAQIIQTVSQNRDDTKITVNDLINAWKAAYLTLFPGDTVTPTTRFEYPLGYHVFYTIFYVKGTDDSTASVIWAASFAGDGGNDTILNSDMTENKNGSWYRKSYANYGEIDRMITNFSKNVSPDKIHPDLVIQKDEVKIIIECSLLYCPERNFADGRQCSKVPFQKALGFYFISPRRVGQSSHFYSFLNAAVIFTPKSGLFSETMPQ